MGFFSFTCAKTNLPILAEVSWGKPYCEVTLLKKGELPIQGDYDGYGRIITELGEDLEIYEEILEGKAKLVLSKFYQGEKFEDLPKNADDPGQGHFHNEEDIEAWWAQEGFNSKKAYREAYFKEKSLPKSSTQEPESIG